MSTRQNTNVFSENTRKEDSPIPIENTFDLTYHAKQLGKGLVLFGAGLLGYVGLRFLWGWGGGQENKTSTTSPDTGNSVDPISLVEQSSFSWTTEFSVSSEERLRTREDSSQDELTLSSTSKTLLRMQLAKKQKNNKRNAFDDREVLEEGDDEFEDIEILEEENTQDNDMGLEYRRGIETEGDNGLQGGAEISIDTGMQSITPRVAALVGGDFIVGWHTFGDPSDHMWGIFNQRFNSIGGKIGSEIHVNTYMSMRQGNTHIIPLDDGGYINFWHSENQDGSGYGIYGQHYNPAGSKEGSEYRVNTYTSNNQIIPTSAKLNDGSHVVIWKSYGQDGSDYGIFGQHYSIPNVKMGTEFQVNSYTTNAQERRTVNVKPRYPAVTPLPNNGFMVAWSSFGQDSDNYGVYGQLFDGSHNKVASEFRISNVTTGAQERPSLACLKDGRIIAVWQSENQDGSGFGIAGQILNNGSKIGSAFQINTYINSDQEEPSVAPLNDGGFLVAWQSYGQDSDDYGVYGQRYDKFIQPFGSEFQISIYTTSYQRSPRLAQSNSGEILIVWYSSTQYAPNEAIMGKIYTPILNPPQLVTNQMRINETQTVTITHQMLNATDISVDDADLLYTVGTVQNGMFEFTTNPGVNIFSFTQQDITNGYVKFVQDGSENAPYVEINVSNGISASDYEPMQVTFFNNVNDAPQIVNNKLTLAQGETIILTEDMISPLCQHRCRLNPLNN